MANHNADTATVADPRDDLQAIKNDMRRLQEDLRTLTNSLGQRARTEARELRDTVREDVEEQLHGVERYVETRPITSILGAFGVGLLVGTLFTLNRH